MNTEFALGAKARFFNSSAAAPKLTEWWSYSYTITGRALTGSADKSKAEAEFTLKMTQCNPSR